MRSCFLFLFILVFPANSVMAQTFNRQKVDSLQQVIGHQKDDSTKVETLLLLGAEYFMIKPDSALLCYREMEDISKRVGYTRGYINANTLSCRILTNTGKQDSALYFVNKAIEAAKHYYKKKTLAYVYLDADNPLMKLGNYKLCAEHGLISLKIAEEVHDSILLANVYNNLNYAYNNLKDYQKAYEYGLKGALLNKALGRKQLTGISLLNVAGSLIYLQKFDSAIVAYKEAESIFNECKDLMNFALTQSGLIYVYERRGEYDRIRPYAHRILETVRTINFPEGTVLGLLGMGDSYFYERDFLKANKYALMVLDSITKYKLYTYLKNTYLFLSEINIGLGNFKQFEYYSNLRDSVEEAQQSTEIRRTTQELDTRYGVEKKEEQLKLQSTKLANNRLWMGILAMLVAAILIVLLLANRAYIRKKKILEQEKELQQQQIIQLEKDKQLMATQAVLKGQEEERTRLAKDLHDGLGGILSGVKYSLSNMKDNMIISADNAERFERTMAMLDQSISELRRVAHNMMPESLTKAGLDKALQDICNSINKSGRLQLTYQSFELHDETIAPEKASVIYRIIQELLNNMLKHAAANEALLQLVRKQDALSITVEDNGKGFNKEILLNNTGMGYGNLQNRITYLQGTIDVQTAPGEGTSVNIEIPNITA